MDVQAKTLNEIIKKHNPALLEMLSERGKNIFFPKLGILAQSAQARGKNINATIGEAVEDDGSSMHLPEFDKLIHLPSKNVFPYAPSFGKSEIRELWKETIYKKNPSLKNIIISKPIATNGLTHGLSMSGYLFVDPGDTLILSDLYWENYNLIFENAYGAHIEKFKLFKDGRFNTESLEQTLQQVRKEKIILLLNFPNNPSGYTPLNKEIDPIVEIVRKQAEAGKKIIIIIDDAYFGLVYEKEVFQESIFTRLVNLHQNVLAIKLDGPTKEDYVWGFRVGFITYGIKGGTPELYEALENKTGGAIRGNISNISHLSQSLLLQAYTAPDYETTKKEKYEILKSRYLTLKEALANPAHQEYFTPLPFNSGYFMCVEVNKGIDAEKVRQQLLDKYSTGVIVFGNVIRLAFSAVPKAKIHQLIDNLYQACKDVKNQN